MNAFYLPDGDAFVSTELTRGPWEPTTQHGGPPCALAARQIERALARPDLQLARVTVELLRPVPIAPLHVPATVVRQGRSAAFVEALITAGGADIARVRSLSIRTVDLPVPPPPAEPPPGPHEGRTVDFFPTGQEVGYHTAMEVSFLAGGFVDLGPAKVWMRMRVPLLPDETPSGWQRVLCAADSGNGVSGELDYRRFTFINPDLTVHLHRLPLGEWVCLDAKTVIEPSGIGLATSAIRDEHGPLGYGLQSLYVAER
jgi:acyl-Coa thioesterase superfamily protein/acyl-CoA thioesterase superfamily protein